MTVKDIEMFNEYLADERPDLPPLPTHKEVCDRCRGEGVLGGYPGVYFQADFDADPEFFEDYMSHRRTCEDCDGLRVIEVPSEGGNTETSRLFREYVRDINEMRAEVAAERRMGA